jgi:hypothetical protein
MFVHGTNTESETIDNLPWVTDNTYDNCMYNENKLSWYSREYSSNQIIDHLQIKSMLFLIGYYNQHINSFPFECHTATWNTDTIEHLKTEKKLPQLLQPSNKELMFNCDNIGFKIIISKKNNMRVFPMLSEIEPDEKPISMMLQESVNHKVRVYHSQAKELNDPRDINYYTVITNQWTWDMARKLIALLPKLYPDAIKIPEELLDIFKLFGGTPEQFDEWAAKYNTWLQSLHLMDEIKIRQLQELVTAPRKSRITSLTRDITNYEQSIKQDLEAIRSYYKAIDQYKMELFGLQNASEEDCHDLYNYLIKNKAIASFTVSGNSYLLFVIRTPWDYYDPEVFNKILTNKHAQIYEYDNGYVAKVLKRAYCVNPDFEVWTDTAVKLDLNARRPQMWESSQCKLMPQVHIMRFDCWGNNKGYIQKALSTGDYIGAIEQIVAATHNINWVDSTVSGIYFDWLSNGFRNRKTIKNLKTGEFISYLDAKNIILDEERQAQLEAEKAKKKAEEERITVEEARLAAEAALAELNRPDVTPEPPAEIAQPTVQEIIAEADRIHEEIQTNPAAIQVNEEELIG